MKKRIISLSLVLMLLITLIPNIVQAQQPIKLVINGKEVKSDAAPFIEDDRTLVPIRVISENLGYEVDWIPEVEAVDIGKYDPDTGDCLENIALYVGETYLLVFDPKTNNDVYDKIESGEMTEEEGDNIILEKAVEKEIDVAPKIVDGRTFVPIRVISENLGYTVNWDAATRTVTIGK